MSKQDGWNNFLPQEGILGFFVNGFSKRFGERRTSVGKDKCRISRHRVDQIAINLDVVDIGHKSTFFNE